MNKRTFTVADIDPFGTGIAGRYVYGQARRRASDIYSNASMFEPVWEGPAEERRPGRARSGPTFGTIGKRYPRARRVRPSKYAKYGVIHKYESRAIVTDPDAVYVGGCTFPGNLVLQAVASAMIRLLFVKSQYAMVDENRNILSGGGDPLMNITVIYKLSPQGAAVSVGSNSTTAGWTTYRGAAEALHGLLFSVGGAASSFAELIEIRLGGALDVTLNCNDIIFDLSGKTICQVQNRTPASTGSTDIGDSDNINANPLRGKVYKGKGTYFSFRFNTDDTGNAPIIQANQENGNLFLAANNADLPAAMKDVIKKPPPAYTFSNMYGTAFFRQDPGRIRKLGATSRMRVKLNSLFAMMLPYLMVGSPSVSGANPLGHTMVVGFEKLCDLEVGVTPALVTVGYECVTVINCVAWKKGRNLINPYVSINP